MKKDEGLFAGTLETGPHPLCVLHSAKIDGILETLKRIEGKIDASDARFDELHGKVLVGNGVPSHASRLQRIESIIGAVVWFLGAAVVALVGAVVTNVVTWGKGGGG